VLQASCAIVCNTGRNAACGGDLLQLLDALFARTAERQYPRERLFSSLVQLMSKVVKALRASHSRWLPGYPIKVLDGNHLSSTEHRLQALRRAWAVLLPGHALVGLEPQHRLIPDGVLSEDGHAQERSLIPQVLRELPTGQLDFPS
jgi:hypothetical protein